MNVRNLFLLNEKERAVRKLRAKLHRLYEENLIICTERINELEKKYEAINCHLKKIEANIQDLHGKMKKICGGVGGSGGRVVVFSINCGVNHG